MQFASATERDTVVTCP